LKIKKKLGEMLVDAGMLTDEQLDEALAALRQSNLKLGQYLTRQGILSESQIADLLSYQLNLEKYRPDQYPIDFNLTKIIPADVAQKHHLAPLRKKGHLLTIAMPDPMDINALDKIEAMSNTEVEPVICTEQELSQLVGSLYGMYADLGGVLESVEEMEIYDEIASDTELSAEDVTASSLQNLAEEPPVVRLVNSVLSQAVREGASDVHISPERNSVQLQFRVDGRLHEVPSPPKSMFLPIASRIKILANMDIAISRVPQDGRFTIRMEEKEINIRASTIPTVYGENIVLRLLDTSVGVYSLERLGMANADMRKIQSVIGKPYGMILSTGPTGCGKSTTLYALLKRIYKPDLNIITVEDPVEYRMERIRQIQLNRRAGMTFAGGLRAILRQDPDVIMVGEVRDAETASIAVRAAMTGHRVLSTVHTNDAAGAITRLIDMGIEPFLVSSTMLVSFAQRLVRTVCPHCKESYRPPERALEYWGLDKVENVDFQRGKGCFHCMDTGYKGRTGIFEILVIDENIQDAILKKSSAQEINRIALQTGHHRTLREDAAEKIAMGITTLEEAASAVML
jgi:type IV pilus assembly protein PilB